MNRYIASQIERCVNNICERWLEGWRKAIRHFLYVHTPIAKSILLKNIYSNNTIIFREFILSWCRPNLKLGWLETQYTLATDTRTNKFRNRHLLSLIFVWSKSISIASHCLCTDQKQYNNAFSNYQPFDKWFHSFSHKVCFRFKHSSSFFFK